ncbi:GIY-YIG nuclease family protein, partial [candidate division WWE3 bacterium]|nr:GIY-YIG nuclease family protein [candidate division WWE3 bacterium]
MASTVQRKIKNFPKVPGVYLFRGAGKRVIYVGKSRNLKDRVSTYFSGNLVSGSKTSLLSQSVADCEYIEVRSELEALLLEAELIKRYKPRYNIVLKDDKSYKYIVIKKEKVDGKVLPVVGTARKKEGWGKNVVYFGPFPEGKTVNSVLRSVRKVIPFRDCSPAKYLKYKKLKSPCLYGHIGLCSAPCVGRVTARDYGKNISLIKKFLAGDSGKLTDELKKMMKRASENREFEEAAHYRNLLAKYEYVSQNFTRPSYYVQNPNLAADLREGALDELVKKIPVLKKPPLRIECFDISNIS